MLMLKCFSQQRHFFMKPLLILFFIFDNSNNLIITIEMEEFKS